MSPFRVLIVDDEPPARRKLRELFASASDFTVVGECADGDEAAACLAAAGFDLVLLDVRMPGMSGIEVARRLVASHPEVVVVLISIEERIDVPSAAQLDTVPLVRKQDFGPRLLRRLWAEHRR